MDGKKDTYVYIYHSVKQEHTFFSNSYWTVTKTDHVLSHKEMSPNSKMQKSYRPHLPQSNTVRKSQKERQIRIDHIEKNLLYDKEVITNQNGE